MQEPTASTTGAAHVGIVFAIGLGLCAALFWDALAAMVDVWYRSSSFNHGFTIFPIAGYLVWERRHALGQLRARPTAWGLPLLLGAALFWLIGRVTGTMVIQQYGMIFVLQTFMFTLLGWNLTRRILFPLAFLLFAVPFGEFLVPRLQDFTAAVVVLGLKLVGIPVFVDGVFITIPSGNFEVAEACSGLRFLIAMVALAVLATQFFYRSIWRMLVFMVLALAIPVFANGLRAFGIVMLAHASNNTIATGVDHIIYGWVFFSLVMLIVLGIGMLFRDRDLHAELPPAIPVGGAGAGTGRLAAMTVAACLVAALAPGFVYYSESALAGRTVGRLAAPTTNPPWLAVPASEPDWRPAYPGTDGELFQTYRAGKRQVSLYIAYYAYQRDGSEVVNSTNRVADGEVWKRAALGHAAARVDGAPLQVIQTRILAPQGNRLVWSWHWVDGVFTADAKEAKLRQARAVLLGGWPEAASIAISAPYNEKPEEARKVLQDFLDQHRTVHQVLAAARR
ncbi:MAG: exosortase A [Hyphomicrobiales bacterium]|nr:exosortase A [Hyphomicrobiales bacterium]